MTKEEKLTLAINLIQEVLTTDQTDANQLELHLDKQENKSEQRPVNDAETKPVVRYF